MKTAAEEIRESIAELEKQIDGLKSQVKSATIKVGHLKAEAKKLTPERIRVPENIKFEVWNTGFALISPNGKCTLFGSPSNGGVPRTHAAGKEDNLAADIITDPLYLEPCKREDLKCGDVVFSCDGEESVSTLKHDIGFYKCILNASYHVFWKEDMDIRVSNLHWANWYKVVR